MLEGLREVLLTGTMVVTITQLVWVNFRGAAMVVFMLFCCMVGGASVLMMLVVVPVFR